MITQEWIDQLPDNEYEIVACFLNEEDFLVQGVGAMSFIDKIADELEYSKIYVKVNTRDDLIGDPVIRETESGDCYFYRILAWAEPIIDNPNKKYVVLFDVDDADDSTVTVLKSFVDKHLFNGHICDNVIVGLTCKDKERVFTCEPLISLLIDLKW